MKSTLSWHLCPQLRTCPTYFLRVLDSLFVLVSLHFLLEASFWECVCVINVEAHAAHCRMATHNTSNVQIRCVSYSIIRCLLRAAARRPLLAHFFFQPLSAEWLPSYPINSCAAVLCVCKRFFLGFAMYTYTPWDWLLRCANKIFSTPILREVQRPCLLYTSPSPRD